MLNAICHALKDSVNKKRFKGTFMKCMATFGSAVDLTEKYIVVTSVGLKNMEKYIVVTAGGLKNAEKFIVVTSVGLKNMEKYIEL